MEITIKARRKGLWSQAFDKCQCCKTKNHKHYAKGLCVSCYQKTYRDYQKKLDEQKGN